MQQAEAAAAATTDADDHLTVTADHDPVQSAENHGESDSEDRATTVSNLEEEMARLLGQITAKRDA